MQRWLPLELRKDATSAALRDAFPAGTWRLEARGMARADEGSIRGFTVELTTEGEHGA